jgi:hypothetical protein
MLPLSPSLPSSLKTMLARVAASTRMSLVKVVKGSSRGKLKLSV